MLRCWDVEIGWDWMRLECCGDCGGTPTSCASSKTPSSRTHDWANGSVSRQTNAPRRHVDGATRCAQVLRVQQRRSSKMARCVGPSGPSKCGAADRAGAAGACPIVFHHVSPILSFTSHVISNSRLKLLLIVSRQYPFLFLCILKLSVC